MPGLRLAGLRSTSTGAHQTLRFGTSWARLGPGRGDDSAAQLVVAPDAPLDASAVRECVERARAAGYRAVLTNALGASEQPAFVELGFTVHEQLHLLVHQLRAEPAPPAFPVGKAARRDRAEVLELDAAAFVPFWRLGPTGLREALTATPVRRFRATRKPGPTADAPIGVSKHAITGYAITGLAGTHGYLQRIAVHPDQRRRGVGRALVADSLRWLWRHGARRSFVNTQFDNHTALALYRSCGFELLPAGLSVLVRSL